MTHINTQINQFINKWFNKNAWAGKLCLVPFYLWHFIEEKTRAIKWENTYFFEFKINLIWKRGGMLEASFIENKKKADGFVAA